MGVGALISAGAFIRINAGILFDKRIHVHIRLRYAASVHLTYMFTSTYKVKRCPFSLRSAHTFPPVSSGGAFVGNDISDLV